MNINGKVFIITGAGSGIGRALAQDLSHRGASLVLADLNSAGLDDTKQSLARPEQARTVTGDITEPLVRAQIRNTAIEAFGAVDVLVNNAGVVGVGTLAETDERMLELMVRVNVLAPQLLVRDLLDDLERSIDPAVVNIGSMFGDIGFPLFVGYSATKFAMRGFSDALRRELAPQGIRVLYIAPRAAKTAASSAFEHLIEPMKMKLDEPEVVAAGIVKAIESDARSHYPRGLERLFVLIQRLRPQLVDNSIIAQLKSLKP